MSAGDVALCNAALLLLGEETIDAFDDGTSVGSSCGQLWELCTTNLQAIFPWRFNTRQQQLARVEDASPVGWTYAYQLPSGIITLRGLATDYRPHAAPVAAWERAGSQVLCNDEAVWATYQVALDPVEWPGPFALLARYALAAELALPVTGKADLMDVWNRRAFGGPLDRGVGGQFLTAMQYDGQQQTPQIIDTNMFIAVRLGGSGP
ncbi:hypothetical protein UFOVP99_21 [uncultured Caudovirales phage]|uniref:Uncharacterized protein n=1 Tax=uncultured Caudovirales phage TaxID=2100421 RepID=A0A6J5L3V3_9CAUD|nr:hypothetical protein UFOVP99_21 [uncultured Caudovirales phage]